MSAVSEHGSRSFPSKSEASTSNADEPLAASAPGVDETSDAQLVAAFQAGDREAGGAIFERYLPLIRRVIGVRVFMASQLDEAVQETCLRILKRLGDFRGGVKLAHYIARTARWTAIDVVTGGHEMIELSDAPPSRLSAEGDTAQTVEDRATVELILGDLSEAHERLLFEQYIEGYSPSEIAAARGTTANTIRVAGHRARKAARRAAASRGLRGVPVIAARVRDFLSRR